MTGKAKKLSTRAQMKKLAAEVAFHKDRSGTYEKRLYEVQDLSNKEQTRARLAEAEVKGRVMELADARRSIESYLRENWALRAKIEVLQQIFDRLIPAPKAPAAPDRVQGPGPMEQVAQYMGPKYGGLR